ncbi:MULTISPECIES: IS30 family transposase, partial [Streptomyces]
MELRAKIAALHSAGLTQAAIGAHIGRDQSVISRELRRNGTGAGYCCRQAERQATERRQAASAPPRKLDDRLLALIVSKLRQEEWSPQQISQWLKRTQQVSLSHERIYQIIWADKEAGGTLYRQLRRSGKSYNKRANKLAGRGIIPGRIDIDQRPAIVDARTRIGDWEVDTIVGKARRGAILSLVERVSRYTVLHKLDAATADLTSRAIIARLRPLQTRVHTITADNGKEFAGHQKIARRLQAEFYFAKPYHAWERGLNENTNGLVHQYFPKGMNFAGITQAAIARVERKLNSRPRKV